MPMRVTCRSNPNPNPNPYPNPNPNPNPNQARDLPHFTSLLRSLRDARVATVVVNVERYGSWRGCDR